MNHPRQHLEQKHGLTFGPEHDDWDDWEGRNRLERLHDLLHDAMRDPDQTPFVAAILMGESIGTAEVGG